MKINDQTLLRQQAYVNGQWIGAVSGETFPVTNPATNSLICSVPDMTEVETRTAIEAAGLPTSFKTVTDIKTLEAVMEIISKY